MPSSANRRSGNSRRAQYTAFLSYILGGAGVVMGAALLIVSLINPDAFAWLRGMGRDATAPVSGMVAGGKNETRGVFQSIAGYFAAGSQNARLTRELAVAKTKLVEAEAVTDENRRLKALLHIAQGEAKPIASARLIGSTSTSSRRFATVDVGAADGVTVGMPVRSELGVVGRVLEVSTRSAQIMLVTDAESVVPVRRAKDDVAGFATGKADGTLQIRLINLGINPLRKGDTLVTSGSGGLYRPGIPIAIITEITNDGGIARVLSDPGATDYVLIDRIWAQEASASPAATATPAPNPSASASAGAGTP